MNKGGYVYILTNKNNTVLYTGVTNSILRRMEEHLSKANIKSFTAQYNCNKLVFFEFYDDIEAAISREKYIKGKSRNFKIQLINEQNSNWENLFEQRDEFNFL